jgi:ribosomal protein L40E
MFSFTVTMFIIITIVVVATMLFGAWIVVSILRGLFRGVGWVLHGGRCSSSRRPAGYICARAGCGAVNPASARFCRRCGQQIEITKHQPLRSAAVW